MYKHYFLISYNAVVMSVKEANITLITG